MKSMSKAWLVFACPLFTACGSDPTIDVSQDMVRSPSTDEGSTRRAPCDQAEDGTECGLEMHCIFNVCVENACGDGVPAFGEACDDGNERDHDGCDQRCRMEVEPGCGNGVLEPGEACDGKVPDPTLPCTPACARPRCGDRLISEGEECDDGNLSNTDDCSDRCLIIPPRCGNGMLDRLEECDDGNTEDDDGCQANCKVTKDAGVEMDAGPTIMPDAGGMPDAGKPDASAPKPDAGTTPEAGMPQGNLAQAKPACAACRNENCAAFQGVLDLVATCFQNPDPTFVQQCIDVMNCAYTKKCGYGAQGAAECFCGTVDSAACQTPGAANGPCQAQWYAAARTSSLSEVASRFSDVNLPSGVANFFLECDRDSCAPCRP